MPKYIEIAHSLKNKIIEGEFKEGELLPNQETLAKTYNTSRVTIRKAIRIARADCSERRQAGLSDFARWFRNVSSSQCR